MKINPYSVLSLLVLILIVTLAIKYGQEPREIHTHHLPHCIDYGVELNQDGVVVYSDYGEIVEFDSLDEVIAYIKKR